MEGVKYHDGDRMGLPTPVMPGFNGRRTVFPHFLRFRSEPREAPVYGFGEIFGEDDGFPFY